MEASSSLTWWLMSAIPSCRHALFGVAGIRRRPCRRSSRLTLQTGSNDTPDAILKIVEKSWSDSSDSDGMQCGENGLFPTEHRRVTLRNCCFTLGGA
jgi:hypothetical protein